MLIRSADNNVEVFFVYGEDGKRTNKYTKNSETLYYNNFWSYHRDGSTLGGNGKVIKHIFLGETRLATTLNDYNLAKYGSHEDEKNHLYYYHADHLGSASLITDNRGDEYERIEYTPYGETWINIKLQTKTEVAPFNYRFSAKELDKETGFYYYGARYLDPKYSRWISADPAMNTGEYFPVAPTSEDARRHNGNLPGMGGVFNHINGNCYHYAGNNPIKYTDPDGREVDPYQIYCFTSEALKYEETIIAADALTVEPTDVFPHKWLFYAALVGGTTLVAVIAYNVYKHQRGIKLVLPAGYYYDDLGNIVGPDGCIVPNFYEVWNEYTKNNEINTKSWGKGSFEDEKHSLLYHFIKHGQEVNANSPEQYLNKAEGFKQNLRNAKKIPSYDPQSGEKNATRYEKNGKYIILDDATNQILSFGKTSE